MSTKRVAIESDYTLEGILNEKDSNKGVIICHPHPLYGGSMHNNVVDAIEEGFSEKGFTTLKFNFRGVGASGGFYDDGEGEVKDVLSAKGFLEKILGEDSYIVLAGYSFGAWICSRAAIKTKNVKSLFIVAYPLSFYDSSPLRQFNGKMHFIAGTFDDIAPVDPLLMVYKELPIIEKYLKIIATDHFFGGKEDEIIDFIKDNF